MHKNLFLAGCAGIAGSESFDLLDGFVLNGRDRRMTRNVYGRTNHHLSEMQK